MNSSLREEPPPNLFVDTDNEEVQEEEILPWENDESNYVVALSGGAFTHLVQNRQDLLKIVLKKAQVYARMRPSEKA